MFKVKLILTLLLSFLALMLCSESVEDRITKVYSKKDFEKNVLDFMYDKKLKEKIQSLYERSEDGKRYRLKNGLTDEDKKEVFYIQNYLSYKRKFTNKYYEKYRKQTEEEMSILNIVTDDLNKVGSVDLLEDTDTMFLEMEENEKKVKSQLAELSKKRKKLLIEMQYDPMYEDEEDKIDWIKKWLDEWDKGFEIKSELE